MNDTAFIADARKRWRDLIEKSDDKDASAQGRHERGTHMSWIKTAPGKYQVWISNICLTFKTERDAQRFVGAMYRAIKIEAPAHDRG